MIDDMTTAATDAAASAAAKKLAETIVKRVHEAIEKRFGIKVEYQPVGLATLIEMYLEAARKEGCLIEKRRAELEASRLTGARRGCS